MIDDSQKLDPKGYAARNDDKLGYRYPKGESYLDVIERLEGVIFELERAKGGWWSVPPPPDMITLLALACDS